MLLETAASVRGGVLAHHSGAAVVGENKLDNRVHPAVLGVEATEEVFVALREQTGWV